ncbi:type II secretion system F family protein [Shewanella submarina]|uniref:Type II secretion system F family protein n=1 Tax=Shewanella submarina TaxID=2016376 RepID=A0ABV7GA18_9GAMM|nr:type II secretion system F family protein [Shewanella submarina]MCL1037383.1 type II secretion system F family protein [Shewanella submarina]
MTLIISIAIGLAIFISIMALAKIRSYVKNTDRQYMDPLPRLLKLVWPFVTFLAYYFGELLSVEHIEKSKIKLRRAGLTYLVTPQQFFALKLISAASFGLASWLCFAMLDKPAGIVPLAFALFGFIFPEVNLNDRQKNIEKQIVKMLPVYLDFITMAVEAGMNLNSALMQAVEKGPPGPLNIEFQKVLRDIKAGVGKIDALRNMSERLNIKEIKSLVTSLSHAEKSGSSVGETLRIQSEQRRTERFQRAEKLAMQAPVKLVGPLVMFIFPTTFIVLFFPIATQIYALFSQG